MASAYLSRSTTTSTNNTKFTISTDKLLKTFISESEIMYNKNS